MKLTPDEDAGESVKITTQDLEYYVILVIKAVAGFERIHSSSAGSTVGNLLPTALHARESICKRKSQSMQQNSLLSDFKKLP